MDKNSKIQLTRSHLESFSTTELIKLADNHGLYIPPELDRVFIIGELLESAIENERQSKEDIKIDTSRHETVELPRQYNVSYIDFLVRDPLWVFVFWEIKELDKETYEKDPDYTGCCLQIVSINGGGSFTVPVNIADTSRYIGFAEFSDSTPEADFQDKICGYKIRLEITCGERVYQIAESNIFYLPRLITNNDLKSIKENPLARLSGIAEMSVIGARG
ncbi:MAG: DUF4912 domain-containing protein [Treponema sp.]|jgi:hypothetical protein|nr:DUF4912 domain-containing protein [Treponema sp.]